MSYTMTQSTYTRLKSRLTRALNAFNKARKAYMDSNKRDAQINEAALKACAALTKEADYGLSVFEDQGYPDAHHNWSRAKDDAQVFANHVSPRAWP
jgi:hypothetical protein